VIIINKLDRERSSFDRTPWKGERVKPVFGRTRRFPFSSPSAVEKDFKGIVDLSV